MPNAYTAYAGSMYSSSVTTGDWERYVAEELVAYIDAHYRTIPRRESRGLVGHSMGGYGAIRIGMKRSDVFANLYVMSPCCMDPAWTWVARAWREWRPSRPRPGGRGTFASRPPSPSAAAWSPNPGKPPLYLDLPVEAGRPGRTCWRAGSRTRRSRPCTNRAGTPALPCHRHGRRRPGSGDRRGDAGASRILTTYGIGHTVEIYDPGDHINRVDERVEEHVLHSSRPTWRSWRPRGGRRRVAVDAPTTARGSRAVVLAAALLCHLGLSGCCGTPAGDANCRR